MMVEAKIVNVEIDIFRGEIKGLNLGVDSNTKKNIVIFQFPKTDNIECRGYQDNQGKRYIGNEFEGVRLTSSQEKYSSDLLKQNNLWR